MASCRPCLRTMHAAFALFVIIALAPAAHAKTCRELGHYDSCILLTNTACFLGNPYECKAISLFQWCYAKTDTCTSAEYCYDPWDPTVGAQCWACNSPCSGGQKTCDGNGYKTCVTDPDKENKCYKWSAVTSCSSGQYCSGGSCASCSNDCSSGQKRCSGSGYQACTTDSNGCWKWGSTQGCGSGYTCTGSGSCTRTCSNQCSSGEKRCNGNGYQTCTTNSNGCRIWSSTTSCGSDEKCSSSDCVKKCLPSNCRWESTATIDEGGTATLKADFVGCGGKNVDVSVYDSDWPVGDPDLAFSFSWTVNGDGIQTKTWTAQWSDDDDGSDIAPEYYVRIDTIDGSCSSGTVLTSTLWLRKVCSNPCAEGAKQCDGNGYKTCKKDKYGCTYWEKTADCASDQKCQDGGCVAKSCQELGHYDWCVLLGNTECHNNNPFECRAISPLQWCYVKTGTCASDEICRDPISPLEGARCEKTCVNECSEQWDTRCPSSGTGYEVCKADDNGCLKWEKAPCTDTQKCQGGTCAAKTCEEMGYYDWCILLGNTKCYDNNPYKCKAVTETTWCYDKLDTCDQNETCTDPLGPQEGAHCEPLGSGCRILSANWSTTNAIDGNNVTMTVTASGCDGKTVNMSIWEDDTWPNSDDYTDSRTAVIVNGIASAKWTVAWQKDCIADLCGDPEYYFTASAAGSSLDSGLMNVGIKQIGKENLSEFLAAHPPENQSCLNSGTMNYECMQKMNALGANYTEISGDELFWRTMAIGWGLSCGGCIVSGAGMYLGYVSCVPTEGLGCAAGMLLVPITETSCGLCLGGDINAATAPAKSEVAASIRSDGVAKVLLSEEAALKSEGAEIISKEASDTGGRIIAKKGGVTEEFWAVMAWPWNKIKQYYRTVVYGDVEAEADDYAIKYILDRPKTEFALAAKEGLVVAYRLEKQNGIKVEFESDAVSSIASRYLKTGDLETLPALLKNSKLDPREVVIRFVDVVKDADGGEITGRMITELDGTTTIELSTSYLYDDFVKGVISEDETGLILKHATLSHETSHNVLDQLLAKGVMDRYPDLANGGFKEYLVDLIKYRIDPDAITATRAEIDKGLWNVQKDMDSPYEYALTRARAIKAGRSNVIKDWDAILSTKLRGWGLDPTSVLAKLEERTKVVMDAGDEIISDPAISSDPQKLDSVLASVSANMFAITGLWGTIDGGNSGNGSVVCTDQCTSGQKRCNGDGYQSCAIPIQGCSKWGIVTPCSSGEVCKDGACTKQTCIDECPQEGQRVCSGTTIKTCTRQANGCLKWDAWTNCQFDEKCESGSCVKTCADQCKPGQRRCSGSGYQACDTLSNGCWRWNSVTACGGAETCEDGKCIARSCNEMGYDGFCMTPGNTACRNGNPYNCRIVSTNRWCWEKLDSCGSDETCKDPFGPTGAYCVKKAGDPVIVTETKPKCYDKCAEGETQCKENDIVSCARNADGCLDWNTVSSCSQDEGCRNAACVKKCTIWNGRPICPASERCDNNVCVPID